MTDKPNEFDPTATPIEDQLAAIAGEVPAEEWAKLDTDNTISEAAREASADILNQLQAIGAVTMEDLSSDVQIRILRVFDTAIQQAIHTATAEARKAALEEAVNEADRRAAILMDGADSCPCTAYGLRSAAQFRAAGEAMREGACWLRRMADNPPKQESDSTRAAAEAATENPAD